MNERSRPGRRLPNSSFETNANRRLGSTALQAALARFGDFENRERQELTPEEWETLVSIVTAWAARANRELLERDELRRRRAA